MSTELTLQLPSSTVPAIVVPGALMAKLEALEKCMGDVVTSEQGARDAAHNLRVATDITSGVEKTRKAIKDPFLRAGEEIDAAAKPIIARAEAAKVAIKKNLTAWEAEQARLQREEEARVRAEHEARQREAAEALRLAEEARLAIEEQRRKDEEAARAQSSPDGAAVQEPVEEPDPYADMFAEEEAARLKREADEKARAASFAPVVPMPRSTPGVSFRVVLEMEVSDVNLLPNQFVTKTPKVADIKRAFCQGWKEGDALPVCPGVTFKPGRTAVSK